MYIIAHVSDLNVLSDFQFNRAGTVTGSSTTWDPKPWTGRLKMQDSKMRHHQKSKGGKCGTKMLGLNHFLTDESLQSADKIQQESRTVAGKPHVRCRCKIRYVSKFIASSRCSPISLR